MNVRVRNLATDEVRVYREGSAKAAVVRAAAEDRHHANPFRMLREMWRLRADVRVGTSRVYCGNWTAKAR